MTYKDRIPGMKPDERNRNIAIGVGYVVILLLLLANFAAVIGLLLLLSPFIIAAIIGKNYKGSAGEMAKLPGISDEGGFRAGASAFVYTLVFVGVLMGGLTALAPSDNTAEEGTEVTEGESEAEATEANERSTVTVIVVDNDGEAIENAAVEFVHDDAIIFDTRENKETDSDGMVSFETETDSHVDISAEASGYEEADASLTVTEDEEVTLTLQEVPEEAEEAEEDTEPADTDEDGTHTVTVYVTDADGEAIESANVEFVHDDAIIFNTRENKETDSEGIVSFETETGSNVDISAEASGYEEADASLTVSQDEEVTLTLQEVPEEPEEAEQDSEAADDTGEDDTGDVDESDADDADETATDSTDGAETEERGAEQEVGVPDYQLVDEGDISYANVVRLDFYVATDAHPDDLSDEELVALAEEITDEATNEQPVNAIVIHIWDDPGDVGWTGNDAKVEWAPYGEWADAGEVETGDYSEHEYVIDRPGM